MKPSIVSDAFEALIGAIYLDGGIESAAEFVRNFAPSHTDKEFKKCKLDAKTTLQEWLQKDGNAEIKYEMTGSSGPDHNKQFSVRVVVNGEEKGSGMGQNKKEAEQVAAKSALNAFGVSYN